MRGLQTNEYEDALPKPTPLITNHQKWVLHVILPTRPQGSRSSILCSCADVLSFRNAGAIYITLHELREIEL